LLLHFCPIDPTGHDVSVIIGIVHFWEHTGAVMSIESVHTPLAHSVLVSLATVQAEPKAAL
jgi:hypothetical protein